MLLALIMNLAPSLRYWSSVVRGIPSSRDGVLCSMSSRAKYQQNVIVTTRPDEHPQGEQVGTLGQGLEIIY